MKTLRTEECTIGGRVLRDKKSCYKFDNQRKKLREDKTRPQKPKSKNCR